MRAMDDGRVRVRAQSQVSHDIIEQYLDWQVPGSFTPGVAIGVWGSDLGRWNLVGVLCNLGSKGL
jgi:hypothetical protein